MAVRPIDANALMKYLNDYKWEFVLQSDFEKAVEMIDCAPTINPDDLRPRGRWELRAHEETCNYRWNVTAKCSECHHSKGEIYAGIFPDAPKSTVISIILDCAESVKLDNYCPNCGADMRGAKDGNQ